MKAIQISKNGGPEVLELKDISLEKPTAEEVTIEHKAIGLNYIDTYHRSGLYPLKLPTGIGAVAYLDRLQKFLGLSSHQDTCQKMIELQHKYWPEAKRTFNPIDIEYLSCECRKYYSYVNGTKVFKGKNKFIPKNSK